MTANALIKLVYCVLDIVAVINISLNAKSEMTSVVVTILGAIGLLFLWM